jgi:hypothetical protein
MGTGSEPAPAVLGGAGIAETGGDDDPANGPGVAGGV